MVKSSFFLSSLKLTLLLFLLLGVGVVSWHFSEHELRNWLITVPLLLLALNLMSAMLTNKLFRMHNWLLAFHFGLLALLITIAVGQVTKLVGQVEVTNGSYYDSQVVNWQQGVFHNNRLEKLQFQLHDFIINYEPEKGIPQRLDTVARLSWLDEEGEVVNGAVGDNVPLEIYGYQLYTTHNKGFAPMFRWHPKQGAPSEGSVHLPPWPAREFEQSTDLHIPGTRYALWLNLKFDDEILYSDRPSHFRAPQDSVLVVRFGEQRHELKVGDRIEFETGTLEYFHLNTWMGFQISYDWTLPWLLAVSLFAVFGLGGHFWKKFAPTPWLDEEKS